MTVGDRIKDIRIKKGISQIALAEAIQVSKQNLYKYENNIITNIPSDKIEAIANFFEVSPATIMGWAEDSSNNTHSYDKQTADPDQNTVILAARGGGVIKRKLTNEQIDLIEKMIQQMPETDEDL